MRVFIIRNRRGSPGLVFRTYDWGILVLEIKLKLQRIIKQIKWPYNGSIVPGELFSDVNIISLSLTCDKGFILILAKLQTNPMIL